jgi:hypothetical protein
MNIGGQWQEKAQLVGRDVGAVPGRGQEAFCILESLLCHGGLLQCFGPPSLGDQSTGATTCVQLKNGGKNSPC